MMRRLYRLLTRRSRAAACDAYHQTDVPGWTGGAAGQPDHPIRTALQGFNAVRNDSSTEPTAG